MSARVYEFTCFCLHNQHPFEVIIIDLKSLVMFKTTSGVIFFFLFEVLRAVSSSHQPCNPNSLETMREAQIDIPNGWYETHLNCVLNADQQCIWRRASFCRQCVGHQMWISLRIARFEWRPFHVLFCDGEVGWWGAWGCEMGFVGWRDIILNFCQKVVFAVLMFCSLPCYFNVWKAV